ncbi:unnamed protein product [Allacma fusca]|uniref:C2H2-type domain-containing protein n=1 Tax=Allacma fusca TaxID=39272 RepID=A0A8J2JXV8_9HEXA|nr:unnamed protein product [Allacma fusca]
MWILDRCSNTTSNDVSGVATLSPSTSDSPELISPYSPCDSSSEPSDVSSCVSGSPLSSTSPTRDVGATFLPEIEQSSSSSSSSSSLSPSTTMTAVSSVLDTQMTSTSKINVTNFISFQIPKAQSSSTRFSNPVKILETPRIGLKASSSGSSSPFRCDVRNISASTSIQNIFAALNYKAEEGMPDLTQAEYQPIVKVPNLRGAKSIILHEGQRNKVIILSVPPATISSSPSSSNDSAGSSSTSSTSNSNNNSTSEDEEDGTLSPVRKRARIAADAKIASSSLSKTKLPESKHLIDTASQIFHIGPKKTENSVEGRQRMTGTELPRSLPKSSLPPPVNEPLPKLEKLIAKPSSPTGSFLSPPPSSISSIPPPRVSTNECPNPTSSKSSSSLEGSNFSCFTKNKCPQSTSSLQCSSSSSSSTSSSFVTAIVDGVAVTSALIPGASRKRKFQNGSNNFSASESLTSSLARSDALESSVSTNSNSSSADSRDYFLHASKPTEQRFLEQTTSCVPSCFRCLWQDCTSRLDATINILEHIQAVHVSPQINNNMDGYLCLWEGCKVFNRKSCSLSWLERHVLTHGGNKPFKCIIPGCGLSFGSQGALERHVNSHISNNGGASGTGPNVAMTNRRVDSSPSKSARRKKQRLRKQRHVIGMNLIVHNGQHADFFDKHTMEVIKYRLVTSREVIRGDQHDCYFRSEVLNWRCSANEEPHVLVRWHPFPVFPDEWIAQSKYAKSKVVPFRQLPPQKIKVLYPNLFPPERKEKARRKWKPSSDSSSSSTISTLSSPSSPARSLDSDVSGVTKDEPNSPISSESLTDEEDYDSPVPDWMNFLHETYVS